MRSFSTHRYRRKNGRKRRYKWSFAAQCAGRVSKLQVLEMIKTLSRFLKNLAVRDGHLRYGYIIILVLCGGGWLYLIYIVGIQGGCILLGWELRPLVVFLPRPICLEFAPLRIRHIRRIGLMIKKRRSTKEIEIFMLVLREAHIHGLA